ncbi:PH domain-containing protein [Nakamurella silvestris]|nr:PH domain-containing protein [Nakamurella silvestris]
MSAPDHNTSTARAVFRLPWSALAIPLLVFMITTPLATALPILNLLFLLPLVALVYVLWTRTVVDAHHLTVYSLRGRRRLPWAELDGLEFRGPRWATAVTMSGDRFRLPMIRPRDLPRLAAVSGGRLLLGADSPALQPAGQDGSADAATAASVPETPVQRSSVSVDGAAAPAHAEAADTRAAQVNVPDEPEPAPRADDTNE